MACSSEPTTGKRCCLALLLILVLAAFLCAQAPAPRKADSAKANPDYRISPAEAQKLLRSVDSILEFDSQASGLRQRSKVKRALAGRDQVERYVADRIRDDEDAQRLQRGAAVLKKFGLLPRDFALEHFLVELLKEQVAGYYDTKTRTVYMLDWVTPETQQPVLAHELTHALQDQNFGLEKWIKQADAGGNRAYKDIVADEAIAARHAAVEGQAMAVMIDFLLAPTGGSLVNSPMITEAIQHGMLEGADAQSPVLRRAPFYIRQLMMFPYTYGLDFIRELLVNRGKDGAYAGVFKKPPQSTRQVMEPATYLSGEQLAPLTPPDLDAVVGPGYERYDVGSVGEFDVSVIVQQFGSEGTQAKAEPAPGEPDAKAPAKPPLWTHWRGGYYYAARKKDAAPGPIAMVYVSRWATPEAAGEFATIYRRSIPKRYTGVTDLAARSTRVDPTQPASGAPSLTLGGTPPAPSAEPECGCEEDAAGSARTSLSTSEGPVSVEVKGNLVLATESFDPLTAAKLRTSILAVSIQPAHAASGVRKVSSDRLRSLNGMALRPPVSAAK